MRRKEGEAKNKKHAPHSGWNPIFCQTPESTKSHLHEVPVDHDVLIDPIPERELYCWRFGPISGRYSGMMVSPDAGKYTLDLRVDIDPRGENSPVLHRVSGDLYQVYSFSYRGRKYNWLIYRISWIVDKPRVTWSKCSVEITGRVRNWKGYTPPTDVSITIPWLGSTIGPATITFTSNYFEKSTFTCKKASNAFRDVMVEVDICQSVNTAPTLPTYNTCAHPDHPADLPCRTLTVEEAYDEAGINVTINPVPTIIDDSANEFNTWSIAELHDAMEIHFSRYPGTWPKWHMWCLLAGTFDEPLVGGVMFDAAAIYGGAGEAPERQGCAVFRNHEWFDDLVTNSVTDAENASMRKLLYTYVHEMGHAFNFLHSWDKDRPDALSWMNYDWKYDDRNGEGSFWDNFRFSFDTQELIHLRHGDRAAVIMGGDPWASGGHMEAPVSAMVDQLGEAPIELLIRSKEFFRFMEPIVIELRIKNNADVPLELDTQLNPEYGGVSIYIQCPDGRTVEYAPILCKIATPRLETLKPSKVSVQGEDRHSENIFLTYGAYGHYFSTPGTYLIRALYQGVGDILIVSSVHQVHIGRPLSEEEDRIAQDYFTYNAGMALYLNGSSSTFLRKGMATLQDMAERFQNSPVGAQLSLVLAHNLKRPFFSITKKNKLEKVRAADTKQALTLTARALEQQKKDKSTFTNIAYHDLRRTRADLMAATGKKEEARKELNTLVQDLKDGGVNEPVLNEIKDHAKKI